MSDLYPVEKSTDEQRLFVICDKCGRYTTTVTFVRRGDHLVRLCPACAAGQGVGPTEFKGA